MIQVYCDTESGINTWLENNQNLEVIDLKMGVNEHGELIMVTYRTESDSVVISKDTYKRMQDRAELLNCLEACGVDNWDGYSDAHEMMEGEEEE